MSLLPLFPRVVHHRRLPLHLTGMPTRPRRHRTVRFVGVHWREVDRVLRRMRLPLRRGAGRGPIAAVAAARGRPPPRPTTIVDDAIIAAVPPTPAPVVRMVRPPFLDLPEHRPRELDPVPRPRDVNRAVRLVDLYAAGRSALQVVHRRAARADDAADVRPFAWHRVGLDRGVVGRNRRGALAPRRVPRRRRGRVGKRRRRHRLLLLLLLLLPRMTRRGGGGWVA